MTVGNPTIVLLSANTGYGHTKAGNSLEKELLRRLPGWTVRHESVFDYASRHSKWNAESIWQLVSVTPILRSFYSAMHRFVVSRPFLTDLAMRFFEGTGERLAKHYQDVDVRLVVALHPGAAAACTYWKRDRDFILQVVATDLVVHGFHVGLGVDRVYCDKNAILASATVEAFARVGRLTFTGLPVEAAFFQAGKERKIGKTILVTFGAKGMGAKKHISTMIDIAYSNKGIRLLVVCGTDKLLKEYTATLVAERGLADRCTIYGFVSNMAELMNEADLVVGKPGGITTGEALASKTRLIVMGHLPGQEEYNLKILQKLGMGRYCAARKIGTVLNEELDRAASSKIHRLAMQGEQGVQAIATSIIDALDLEVPLYPIFTPRMAV